MTNTQEEQEKRTAPPQEQGKASSPDKPASPAKDSEPKKPGFFKRPLVIILGTLILMFLFWLLLHFLVNSWVYETTDDAFLDGQVISVAPKVAGQVARVPVVNNQAVKAGDLLVEINPQDLGLTLEQKNAATHAAEANVDLLKASLKLLHAQVASAEAIAKQSQAEAEAIAATAQKAQADYQRAQELFAQKAISSQEFDAAKAANLVAQANLNAAREKSASDVSKVEQASAQLEAGKKAYERGVAQTHQSELDTKQAELNLSYGRVLAPEDGFVTHKAVEGGDYVQVGQRLMALVAKQLWVTANFKETQLTLVRPNQPVEIEIDALGETFPGHVESIQAGSGAHFSLLPPENAVGNYVKVVQRVPVKILFDQPIHAAHVIGPGMSVEPRVRVRDVHIPGILLIIGGCVLGLLVGFFWWRGTQKPRQES